MSATRMATLDGTWELHPMIVLQPVEPHTGRGFTINFEDIEDLLAQFDEDPTAAEDGFVVQMVMQDGQATVEFPPGEPARNAVAALRWFSDALHAAGPMPATTG